MTQVLSFLFPFQKPIDSSSFAVRIALLYVLYGLAYNIHEVFLILFPTMPILHSITSMLLPIALVYMLCAVLFQRMKALTPKSIFSQAILAVSFILFVEYKLDITDAFLELVGLSSIYKNSLLAVLLVNVTAFFLIIGLLGIIIFCCAAEDIRLLWNKHSYRIKKQETVSASQPKKGNKIPQIALAAFIFLVNGSIGFDSLVGAPFETQREMLVSAKLGSENKQMRVAGSLAVGIGTPKDLEQAAHWYSLSSANGIADASYYAGLVYDEQKNLSKAEEWHQKAADKGSDAAKHRLGLLSIASPKEWTETTAPAVCKKNKDAFDEGACRKLAIAGYTRAQIEYAKLLERKHRFLKYLPKNLFFSDVIFWYEQAANAGDREAQGKIAELFQGNDWSSEYYRRDLTKAAHWYAYGAKQGAFWLLPRAWVLTCLSRYTDQDVSPED